jgi:hypothetical protein
MVLICWSCGLAQQLEITDVAGRYRRAIDHLKKEIEMYKLSDEVKKETMERFNEQVKKQMLMEKYKHIRNELGLNKDDKQQLAKKYTFRLSFHIHCLLPFFFFFFSKTTRARTNAKTIVAIHISVFID